MSRPSASPSTVSPTGCAGVLDGERALVGNLAALGQVAAEQRESGRAHVERITLRGHRRVQRSGSGGSARHHADRRAVDRGGRAAAAAQPAHHALDRQSPARRGQGRRVGLSRPARAGDAEPLEGRGVAGARRDGQDGHHAGRLGQEDPHRDAAGQRRRRADHPRQHRAERAHRAAGRPPRRDGHLDAPHQRGAQGGRRGIEQGERAGRGRQPGGRTGRGGAAREAMDSMERVQTAARSRSAASPRSSTASPSRPTSSR